MYILGVSALYHDSAAALINDGVIVAAAQEERFTRLKNDLQIPVNAIKYVLTEAKISADDLDAVVYYDDPLLTLDRFIKNVMAIGGDAKTIIERYLDSMTSRKMWIHKHLEQAIGGVGKYGRLLTVEHHYSHAASAFYPSPFEEAVIITIDGVGEWDTTTIGLGKKQNIKLKKAIQYPHSLGLLYSAFTVFCGFKANSGEYKFMGLAPYGKPVYYDLVREKLISIKDDGSYRLNMEYFDYHRNEVMTNKKFAKLFGGDARVFESRITKREMDLAASVQKVLEEVILLIAQDAKKEYGQNTDALVLAGGVALNCVANGKLYDSGIYKNIWIQPAAGDAGGALGCALYAYYNQFGGHREIIKPDGQKGSYLGPGYKNNEVENFLRENQYPYRLLTGEKFYDAIAQSLDEGKVIGLFQGRMEYGPRALGARSIICDPRSPETQARLNMKIKFRESFRPFAPSVLEERVSDYFEMDGISPYMLLVEKVREERRFPFNIEDLLKEYDDDMLPIVNRKRSDIPAVTHVDYSARIQTVSKEISPVYYNIIKAYEKRTGCGVIVNTSFNVRGEPIVCTPEEAYTCFMRTEMDILVLENCVLQKYDQPWYEEKENWRKEYELD